MSIGIITIGQPGSGKTTFQSFLLRYLMEETKLANMNISENGERHMMNNNLRDWTEMWRAGRLPSANSLGDIKTLRWELLPADKKKPELDFSFLEVAGEDLKTVEETDSNDVPKLPEEVRDFIDTSEANSRLFVLICDGSNPHVSDQLATATLEYLSAYFDEKSKKIPILILLSKPILARNLWESETKKALPGNSENFPANFVGKYMSLTIAQMQKMGLDYFVKPLFIGKIQLADPLVVGEAREEGNKNAGVSTLAKPDFEDIGKIFLWIYEMGTGKKLENRPGFLKRVLRVE